MLDPSGIKRYARHIEHCEGGRPGQVKLNAAGVRLITAGRLDALTRSPRSRAITEWSRALAILPPAVVRRTLVTCREIADHLHCGIFDGSITSTPAHENGPDGGPNPTNRCKFPEVPPRAVPVCAGSGVFGVLPNVLG